MPLLHSSSRTAPRRFTAWLAAVALLSLLVRGFQLSQRTFYWDDFLIPATFSGGSLGDYFASYDGHLMPASALVQVLAHRIAPLSWWLPATVLMLLSVLAAALWAKVCMQLTGHSLATLGLYTALLFSPFLMDAAGWWSAGINALAWQIGMAGFMVCLLSAPTSPKALLRYSVFATGFLFIALLFTEKALTIVPAALALAVLAGMARRDIARFFAAPGALFVIWSLLFLTLSPLPNEQSSHQSLWSALPNSLFTTVIPGALGGPLSWDRWSPSSTFSTLR